MTTRSDIVSAARRYIGTPFVHQGRHIEHGVDCAGLLMCVAYDVGLSDVRVTDYGRMPDANRSQSIIESHMDPVPYSNLMPGDALSFVILQDVQHYGIVVESGRFIHAYQPAGKVVETSLSGPWLHRLRGCYSFRGLA